MPEVRRPAANAPDLGDYALAFFTGAPFAREPHNKNAVAAKATISLIHVFPV